MFTNEEYEAMLRTELEEMKVNGQIRRYDVTYKPFTGKFDICLEWADYRVSNICGVVTVDELKAEFNKMLPVKKSFKCFLCRYYVQKCDGCKKGYFNSIFVPCPDFKAKEIEPSDKETSQSLKSIIKETANMFGPDAESHKLADELMCYILEAKGYEKGVKVFKKLIKGYEGFDDECEYLQYNDIIQWQCIMCRYAKQLEGGCRDGLDEGWYMNNECPQFKHLETPITPSEFEMYMEMLMDERECSDEIDDLDEELHYNMDKLITYVVRSLGYSKTADIYESMNKHYLTVPF